MKTSTTRSFCCRRWAGRGGRFHNTGLRSNNVSANELMNRWEWASDWYVGVSVRIAVDGPCNALCPRFVLGAFASSSHPSNRAFAFFHEGGPRRWQQPLIDIMLIVEWKKNGATEKRCGADQLPVKHLDVHGKKRKTRFLRHFTT